MKTAVSMPDDLFRRAERLARALGKSRSELYRDALTDYVRRHDPHAVTGALDEFVAKSAPEADQWLGEAGRRALERTEW